MAAGEAEFALLLRLAVVGVPRVGGGVFAVQLAVLSARARGDYTRLELWAGYNIFPYICTARVFCERSRISV